MIIIGAMGLAVGAVLALRFSAFGLLLAVVMIGVLTLLVDVAAGGAVRHAVLAAATAAIGLQFGFIGGVLIIGVAARTRNERWRATTGRTFRAGEDAALSQRSRIR